MRIIHALLISLFTPQTNVPWLLQNWIRPHQSQSTRRPWHANWKIKTRLLSIDSAVVTVGFLLQNMQVFGCIYNMNHECRSTLTNQMLYAYINPPHSFNFTNLSKST